MACLSAKCRYRGAGDPGRRGDVVDADAVVAAGAKQLRRDGGQLALAVARALVLRGSLVHT